MKTLCVLILASMMLASMAYPANIVYYSAINATQYSNDLSTIIYQNLSTIQGLAINNITDALFNYTNIKVSNFVQQTTSPNYSYNATNGSIINNDNPVFAANVTFNYSYNNGTLPANVTGTGVATLLTNNNATLSRYYNSQYGKPILNCTSLNWEWTSPQVIILTNSSAVDVPTDAISTTFGSIIVPQVATLNASILGACDMFYNQTNFYWNTKLTYESPLSRNFDWNNTYHFESVNGDNKAVVASVDGTIQSVAGYSAIGDTTTVKIPVNGKAKQVAYSIQGLQNFIKYAVDQQLLLGNFDRDIYSLPTFDYTINDLTDIVPSLINNNSLTSFVEFTCLAVNNPSVNFSSGAINVVLDINCGVNPIGKPDILLNVTFTVNSAVLPQTPTYGAVNFNVASISYVQGSAKIPNQSLSTLQTAILEYHVASALRNIPGTRYTRQVFGSGINLPWKSITDVDFTYDANWMYLAGN